MKLSKAQQTHIDMLKNAGGKLPVFTTKGVKLQTVRTLVEMGLVAWSDPRTTTDIHGRVWTTHTTITLL